MTAPQFIDTDEQAIIARLKSHYETETGRSLQPAQAEQLLVNMVAYEMKIVREQMQAAAEQMLVAFANAPALDYLAQLVGVTRLPASGAVTTLQFTVASGHPGVVIPSGTRVATSDGQIIFKTSADLTVNAGSTTGTVSAISTTVGAAGNDYAVGDVNNILDPRPFLSAVTNTTATSTGSDAETDDELRERIQLAPAQFSVAGPTEAYAFFAREASAAIIDVSVTSPIPGTVNVYPLISGGVVTPPEILALVNNALNAEDVRPLTDTVVVLSPTVVNYDVEIEIVAYTDANTDDVQAAALAAVQVYTQQRQNEIGQDVKRSQLTALAVGTAGDVFDVNIVSPASDVVIDETQVPVVGTISVTVTSQSDG